MINVEEAQEQFDELSELLVTNGFEWVVENARAIFKETTELNEFFAKGSEPDQLTILFDEIERCIIQPTRLASTLPRRLSTPTSTITKIDVVDDEGVSLSKQVDPKSKVRSIFPIETAQQFSLDAVTALEKAIASQRAINNASK